MLSIVSDALAKVAAYPDPFSISANFMNPGIPGEECRVESEVLKRDAQPKQSQQGLCRTVVKESELPLLMEIWKASGINDQIEEAAPAIPSSNNCLLRTGDLQGIELSLAEQVEVRLHPEFFSFNHLAPAESLGCKVLRWSGTGSPCIDFVLRCFSAVAFQKIWRFRMGSNCRNLNKHYKETCSRMDCWSVQDRYPFQWTHD